MDEERDRDLAQEQSLVDRFILNRIDSVPHLEALLLIWRSRTEARKQSATTGAEEAAGPVWNADRVARRLWITTEVARSVLRDLERNQLISAIAKGDERYCYQSEPERDRAIEAVETAYARDMIRISNMIHSKGSAAVRDFARAFRLKKDPE